MSGNSTSQKKDKWEISSPTAKGKQQAENTANFIVWLAQFEDSILYCYL